jgi:hypothetical protein
VLNSISNYEIYWNGLFFQQYGFFGSSKNFVETGWPMVV